MKALVYDQPLDVKAQLSDLGLTLDDLHDAIAQGEAARNSCTGNDPAILRGLLGWARTIRGLRDVLGPKGWLKSNMGGLEQALNPDKKIALTAATGDDSTGLKDPIPKTKHTRGPATKDALARNRQLLLALLNEPDSTEDTQESNNVSAMECITWILLVASEENEVRCELSRPKALDKDGHVNEWEVRILLPPFQKKPSIKITPANQEPDIDVGEVRRKGGDGV